MTLTMTTNIQRSIGIQLCGITPAAFWDGLRFTNHPVAPDRAMTAEELREAGLGDGSVLIIELHCGCKASINTFAEFEACIRQCEHLNHFVQVLEAV